MALPVAARPLCVYTSSCPIPLNVVMAQRSFRLLVRYGAASTAPCHNILREERIRGEDQHFIDRKIFVALKFMLEVALFPLCFAYSTKIFNQRQFSSDPPEKFNLRRNLDGMLS